MSNSPNKVQVHHLLVNCKKLKFARDSSHFSALVRQTVAN
jgi:hypothetical protein